MKPVTLYTIFNRGGQVAVSIKDHRRTLAVDGDPEILLGVICLKLRVRDNLGHVCDGVGDVEASGRRRRDGNEMGMQTLRRIFEA